MVFAVQNSYTSMQVYANNIQFKIHMQSCIWYCIMHSHHHRNNNEHRSKASSLMLVASIHQFIIISVEKFNDIFHFRAHLHHMPEILFLNWRKTSVSNIAYTNTALETTHNILQIRVACIRWGLWNNRNISGRLYTNRLNCHKSVEKKCCV